MYKSVIDHLAYTSLQVKNGDQTQETSSPFKLEHSDTVFNIAAPKHTLFEAIPMNAHMICFGAKMIRIILNYHCNLYQYLGNSADDNLIILFYFFFQKIGFDDL